MLLILAGLAAALPQAAPDPGARPLEPRSGSRPGSGRLQAPSGTPDGAGPAAVPPAPSGVTSYPAAFFAAAQPASARDMVARLPGFTFDDGSGARGFDAAAGNVLVDGELPAGKSDDLESVLRRLPASRVLRIDVIRGGAPGIDMHGKTLVANVVRRSGSADTGDVQLSDRWVTSDGRQTPSVRIEATRQRGGRTMEGSLAYSRFADEGLGSGGVIALGPNRGRLGSAGDYARAGGSQASGTASYATPLGGGTFRINASLQHQAYASDEVVGPEGGSAVAPSDERDVQVTTQAEVGLHYARDLGPRLGLEALAIQRLGREAAATSYRAPGDAESFRERHADGETVARVALTWRRSPRLTLEAGVEAAANRLRGHTSYVLDGDPVALPAADVGVTERRGEAFAKATATPSGRLSVEAGLRVEASRIAATGDVALARTLLFAKPRLVAAWTPAAGSQLRVRLEREVGQLDFGDFVAAASLSTGHILAGNPDLRPQSAWVAEAAFERRLLGDGSATVTLRRSALADVVDRAPVVAAAGAFDAPANIGGGRRDEAVAGLNLPLRRLGFAGGILKADLTWRRSSVRDPTTGSPRPISGVRPFEGTVGFSDDLPRHRLNWGAELDVGWAQTYYRFDQVETDAAPVQGRLYVEARPWRRWSVLGEIADIGGGSGRTLTNWSGSTAADAPFHDREVRTLAFGPVLRLRVRRDW